MFRSKERWNGLAQRIVYRQTALNILKNHFDEAVSLNKKVKRFSLFKNKRKLLLSVESFLLTLAKGELPYSRATLEHWRLIVKSWPMGTVIWEDLPPERNPYHSESSGFKAKNMNQIIAEEIVKENRDLVLSTAAQGRKAFELGLSETDCELSEDLLKEIWLMGFRIAREKSESKALELEAEREANQSAFELS
jgi:hypothetical protein